jgi:hypothetical protein
MLTHVGRVMGVSVVERSSTRLRFTHWRIMFIVVIDSRTHTIANVHARVDDGEANWGVCVY